MIEESKAGWWNCRQTAARLLSFSSLQTTTQAEMERPKYVTCYSSQQQDHVYIILP